MEQSVTLLTGFHHPSIHSSRCVTSAEMLLPDVGEEVLPAEVAARRLAVDGVGRHARAARAEETLEVLAHAVAEPRAVGRVHQPHAALPVHHDGCGRESVFRLKKP